MKLTTYLGDRAFWRTTTRIALPVIIQNLLTSSFALIDTLMVSRLGDAALSSVGMAGQWVFVMNMCIIGLTGGMSMFASQYFGIGDYKGIRRAYGITLLSGVLLVLAFFLPAALHPRGIIGIFNQEAQILDTGSRYMRIACWSYPATMLSLTMSSLLRSIEKVQLPMYTSAVTTVLNVVFNYGLIFGKLGMPRMGVEGAALATCISAWAGPVFLFLLSLREKNLIATDLKGLFAFRWRNVVKYYKKTLPVLVNSGTWAIGTMIVNTVFSNMGSEYYAAVTILRTFGDLCFACYLGFGNASIVLVGQAVGAGRIAEAKECAIRCTALVLLASLIEGILLALFRRQLISVFNNSGELSALTHAAAMSIILFYGLEQPLRNIPYIHIDGVFRSGGDTVTGAIFDAICLWLVSLPVAFLSARVWRLPFVTVFILAYLCEDILKGILCFWHFLSWKWLRPVTEEGKRGLAEYNAKKGKK